MPDFPPTHPGEVLREDFLKPLGLSRYALAKAIGVPQIRISEITNGKRAITPDTALRLRSEEHTSELQSLMRNSSAVFCLKTKNTIEQVNTHTNNTCNKNA